MKWLQLSFGTSKRDFLSPSRGGNVGMEAGLWSQVLGCVLSLRCLLRWTWAVPTGLIFCWNVDVCVFPDAGPGEPLCGWKWEATDVHPSGSFQPQDERTGVENLLNEFQSNPGSPSPAQVHSLIHFWPFWNFCSILNPLKKKKKTVLSGVRNQSKKIVILSHKIIQTLYSGYSYTGVLYFKAKKQLLACEW